MRSTIISIFLCFFLSSLFAQEDLSVIGWNIESGGSKIEVIAERLKIAQGIDIWGLSEVNGPEVVSILEAAAEDGENSDFSSVLGTTGGSDRLLIIFDVDRFDLVRYEELEDINIGGNVRAPLVALLAEKSTGIQFYFMVNHLYRSNNERRHQQSRLLNEWAGRQSLPVIAVGDYNYDWEIADNSHDLGYDLLTAGEILTWLQPKELIATQCAAVSGGCRYNSVLDFVFIRNVPSNWQSSSEILKMPNDFPDDESTSDHRQVMAKFRLAISEDHCSDEFKEHLLQRISKLEEELQSLKSWIKEN